MWRTSPREGLVISSAAKSRGCGRVELSDLEARLSSFTPRRRSPGDFRCAAVLLLLIEEVEGADLEVLFIRRSDQAPSHAGQVAFPGGIIQNNDADNWSAALRESHEEIGLEPQRVKALGFLDDYVTITGYHVTPCVGLVKGRFDAVPNPREVAETFRVPLEVLRVLKSSVYERAEIPGITFRALCYEDQVIWGATAAMLRSFLKLIDSEPFGPDL
jgi:8-oxo-dGTP pyrophosphatase MutT (NUDIX family)